MGSSNYDFEDFIFDSYWIGIFTAINFIGIKKMGQNLGEVFMQLKKNQVH
jgi:hypothetical protein